MLRLYIIALLAAVVSPMGVCHAVPLGFEPYQIIIDREIFGRRAAPVVTAPPAAAIIEQRQAELLAKRLTMCAVNRTPSGNIAVGFIDNEAKPPRNIYLNVGESADGYRIVAADYDAETATIEKENVTITLKLGQGLIAVPSVPGPASRPPRLTPPAAGVRPPTSPRAAAAPRRLGMSSPTPVAAPTSYREGRQARDSEEQKRREAEEQQARESFEALAREVAAAEVRRQVLAQQGLTEEDLEFDEDEDAEETADEE